MAAQTLYQGRVVAAAVRGRRLGFPSLGFGLGFVSMQSMLLEKIARNIHFLTLMLHQRVEQELRNIIDHLSSVDVLEHVTSLNKAEVFLMPESDPKTVPHSVGTSQDSMQHMWNHQTGDDITTQKEKGNTCSREEVFNPN